jgi:hypothetical protein
MSAENSYLLRPNYRYLIVSVFKYFSERILLLVCQTTPLTFVLILSANIKGPKRYVRLRACLFELILFKTWILKLQVKANFWIGFWIN